MLKRLTSVLCMLSILSFLGCHCTLGDCYPSDFTIVDIRFVSSVDSSDLIFGPDPLYAVDDIKVFGLLPNEDTIIYKLNLYEQRNVLELDYQSFDNHRMFIDYGNEDIDTLDFNFFTVDVECCGDLTRIRYASQNGNLIYDRLNSVTDILVVEK